MSRQIAVIQGHPDRTGGHFCHALADAYIAGATKTGHEIRSINVGELEFPFLRNPDEFADGTPPESILECQRIISWANHLVLVYPLWLGTMPALLKAWMEQVFRPGFALESAASGGMPKKLLKGKSARIVVTMGMPAFFYRWYYRAHSLKSLERNILSACGIAPIRDNLIGLVGRENDKGRISWRDKLREFGEQGT